METISNEEGVETFAAAVAGLHAGNLSVGAVADVVTAAG